MRLPGTGNRRAAARVVGWWRRRQDDWLGVANATTPRRDRHGHPRHQRLPPRPGGSAEQIVGGIKVMRASVGTVIKTVLDTKEGRQVLADAIKRIRANLSPRWWADGYLVERDKWKGSDFNAHLRLAANHGFDPEGWQNDPTATELGDKGLTTSRCPSPRPPRLPDRPAQEERHHDRTLLDRRRAGSPGARHPRSGGSWLLSADLGTVV